MEYLERKYHELEGSYVEEYLDFQEGYYRALVSAFEFPPSILRSRDFRRRTLAVQLPDYFTSKIIFVRTEGRIVALAQAWFKESRDELKRINFSIFVLPEYRGRGIARDTYKILLDFATEHGRNLLSVSLLDGEVSYTADWLKRLGFSLKMKMVINMLQRDKINWEFIEEKEMHLENSLGKYEILLLSKSDLNSRLLEDDAFATELADFTSEIKVLMPREDLEDEPEAVVADDLRRVARNYFEHGSTWDELNFFLLDGDKIIARSQILHVVDSPVKDFNTGITGVRRAYQRLGIATFLKIKVIRHIIASFPEFEFIKTENAASNAGMLSINHKLGFRSYFENHTYQKRV